MNHQDREALKRFILENSPDETLARSSFSVLHDYFLVAENWKYRLEPAGNVSTDGVKVPISLATGRTAESVTKLSVSRASSDFRGMLEFGRLGYLVSRQQWKKARQSLDGGLRDELWKHLMQGGLDRLPHCLCLCLAGSSLAGSSYVIARSMTRLLFCYLACILRGDREGAADYAPLAYLLPKIIPLGFSRDDPAEFIVVVG